MHETAADLVRLQGLLDDSYATAGTHLRSIITPERRMSAADVSARLQGMCLLVLATVTADGRPITAPVDGIFFRGDFYFGSAPDSLRFAHIERNPAVSATHAPREELSVTVHGRATHIDTGAPDHAGFRQTLLDIYRPEHGSEWEAFLESGAGYARIDAERMFTFLLAGPTA